MQSQRPHKCEGSEGRPGPPLCIPSKTAALPSTAYTASVLFSQERLDELSKQKNERGEYSVNAYFKMLF